MMLEEIAISRAIIDSYWRKLGKILEVDVVICGAGPSGLVCAATLAKKKKKVVVFEKKLSIGGGMWAGGMFFNEIVIQDSGKKILEEYKVKVRKYKKNYYLADAVECVCSLGYHVIKAGAIIINGVSVEDVVVRKSRICGVVINWSAVELANLHVDPLAVKAKFVVDATGHSSDVVRIVEEKSGLKLNTKIGKRVGERSMWVDLAESMVEKNTQEVVPGLVVAGMCANAVFGSPRMGPIFGGMLLSGKRAAEIILSKIK
ncbi:MAG: ribose 1,5-bisphosphate isomerase [Candidatus Omnitrophota bacterium]|nr:MAG: ribose 1,5-bisphosphate isomerase [Candidatus Omnitrophota bacterium]